MSTMGRKRGGRFADRPKNVSITTTGDVTYFIYNFPEGHKKTIGNSRNVKEAYDIAEALNGHFAAQRAGMDFQKLMEPRLKVESPRNPRLVTLIEEWRQHVLSGRIYSDRSHEEIAIRLRLYERKWPRETVRDFDTFKIAEFLDTLTMAAWVKHRKQLLDLFQLACHKGYINENPVAGTLIKHAGEKIRRHHTMEGYKKIYEAAEPWLRRAIDLAVYSLQRRDDLVNLMRSQVDLQARTLTVLQRKTRNYANPVYLEIVMAGELHAAVAACIRSDIPCPYLVRARPRKMFVKAREAKPHPFAVLPNYLTTAFRETRDAAKAYSDLAPEERPTFHELRGFGIHLYEAAGFDRTYIMALSGHATEAMFEHYKRDHEQLKPKRVEAGLTRVFT